MTKDILSTLSRELNDLERTDLLSKLQSSVQEKKNENYDPLERRREKQKELNNYLDNIYKNSHIVKKVLMKIYSFFSGISVRDLLYEEELKVIHARISEIAPRMYDEKKNRLTFEFCKIFVPFVHKVYSVISMLTPFIEEKVYYFEFIAYFIEKYQPKELSSAINDLYPTNIENQIEFLNKDIYMAEKEKKINFYFSAVRSMPEKDEDLNSLEYLFKLLNFDFYKMLQLFNLYDIKEEITEKHYAEIGEDLLGFLRKINRLLISLDTSLIDKPLMDDFFEYLDKFPLQYESTLYEIDTLELKSVINELFILLRDVKTGIPLTQIIQLAENDIIYMPRRIKIDIEAFPLYETYKRTVVNNVWEGYFEISKRNNVLTLLDQFLGEIDHFKSLPNLTVQFKESLEELSGHRIKHYNKLNFLYEFYMRVYSKHIEKVMNTLLVKGTFQSSYSRSVISTMYFNIETDFKIVLDLDQRFSPESNLYKKIISASSNFDANIESNRIVFVNIAIDVNRALEDVDKRIYGLLEKLSEFFKDINNLNDISKNPIVNFHSLQVPGYQNPYIAVEEMQKYLTRFFKLYKLIEEVF